MERRDTAQALVIWAFLELPFLIVLGVALQGLFGGGLGSDTAWHVVAWLLTATGFLAVAAVFGFPNLRKDELSAADLALPILAIALLAASAILAAQGFYSWASWGSGVGLGVVLSVAGVVLVRRAESRAVRDVEEAELERRDHERRLAAHGDAPRIL